MVYIILAAFLISYISTMCLIADMDSPSNYTNVKDYMHSKYYIFINCSTGLLIGCIVALFLNTKEWVSPLIAFIILLINNIILANRKKRHLKNK